jgi:hypothetical protein
MFISEIKVVLLLPVALSCLQLLPVTSSYSQFFAVTCSYLQLLTATSYLLLLAAFPAFALCHCPVFQIADKKEVGSGLLSGVDVSGSLAAPGCHGSLY